MIPGKYQRVFEDDFILDAPRHRVPFEDQSTVCIAQMR
jgi:hypothetical protein